MALRLLFLVIGAVLSSALPTTEVFAARLEQLQRENTELKIEAMQAENDALKSVTASKMPVPAADEIALASSDLGECVAIVRSGYSGCHSTYSWTSAGIRYHDGSKQYCPKKTAQQCVQNNCCMVSPSYTPFKACDASPGATACPSWASHRYPGNNRCFEKVWGGKACNVDPANDPHAHQQGDLRCNCAPEAAAACAAAGVSATFDWRDGWQHLSRPVLPAGWSTGATGTYAMTFSGSPRTPGGRGIHETGPSTFPPSGIESFYYAEASGRQPGDVFELAYSGSDCAGGVRAVTFEYHMYDRYADTYPDEMGTLSVVAGGASKWSKTGNQGNVWKNAVGVVLGGVSSFKFKYVRGGGNSNHHHDDRGDAAIGSVTVLCASATPSPLPEKCAWAASRISPPPPSLPPSLPPRSPSKWAPGMVCGSCKAGWKGDGGVDLFYGTHGRLCTKWCSPKGFCGVSSVYKTGGTDCHP
jgi:hypothetical protein